MKLFQSRSALLFVLIVGLVWSEQLEQDDETSDLETAESAFIDPKLAIFTGLAGLGALVVKGAVLGAGAAKLLLFAKHAGSYSHGSSEWDSSSYSSHSSYPAYKSYSSSSYSSSSHSSGESEKPTAYTGSLKVSGSLTPVSSPHSDLPASSSTAGSTSTTSSTTESTETETSLSLDGGDDPLPEN